MLTLEQVIEELQDLIGSITYTGEGCNGLKDIEKLPFPAGRRQSYIDQFQSILDQFNPNQSECDWCHKDLPLDHLKIDEFGENVCIWCKSGSWERESGVGYGHSVSG